MFWNTNKAVLIILILALAFWFFLPRKSHGFFTKSYQVSENTISATFWESYDFSTPLKAGESVGNLFLSGNFNILYENLAEDLAGIYTKMEFATSLKDAKIAGFEIYGDAVYTNTTQAYVVMKIKYLNRSFQEYKTVFNYENGSWKLLGTKLVE
ncbi:MAG: hypothetical protein ABIB98_03025 [bacterium]